MASASQSTRVAPGAISGLTAAAAAEDSVSIGFFWEGRIRLRTQPDLECSYVNIAFKDSPTTAQIRVPHCSRDGRVYQPHFTIHTGEEQKTSFRLQVPVNVVQGLAVEAILIENRRAEVGPLQPGGMPDEQQPRMQDLAVAVRVDCAVDAGKHYGLIMRLVEGSEGEYPEARLASDVETEHLITRTEISDLLHQVTVQFHEEICNAVLYKGGILRLLMSPSVMLKERLMPRDPAVLEKLISELDQLPDDTLRGRALELKEAFKKWPPGSSREYDRLRGEREDRIYLDTLSAIRLDKVFEQALAGWVEGPISEDDRSKLITYSSELVLGFLGRLRA